MTIKIGINGFGRIGRMVLRSIIENNRKDIEVVAINNRGNAEVSSFLLAHDTIHGSLKNKTFILTGKLKGISRAEAKSLIEKNSGKIISNVSKKLDYLIIGEKPTIKKINFAKELNINVISQDEWIKMLNKTS